MESNVLGEACRAYAAAKGDRVKATQLLVEAAEQDDRLRDMLTRDFLRRAAWSAVTMAAHHARQEVWDEAVHGIAPQIVPLPGEKQSAPSVDGLVAVGASALSVLDKYTLPNRVRLGDATREDLAFAIEFEGSHARARMRNRKLYQLILRHMGKADRVRDVLKDDDVLALALKAGVKLQDAA